jgi:hypothetical protein
MGKITRNRVMYGGTDILISNSPSWNDQTNLTNLKLLKRVTSSSISISNPVTRTRQVGSSDFTFQKYTNNPEIEVGINYYASDNSNELMLGLVADNTSGIFSNFAKSGGDKNLYFILTDSDGQDADGIEDAVGLDVFAVGNAFLNNYSFSAAVGDLATVDLGFSCVNMVFETYAGTGPNGSEVPAINLPLGTKSTEKYTITGFNFDLDNYISNQSNRPSALRPGDIGLEIPQPIMGGVRYSGESPANITSMSINIPIERKDLIGFGSNFPYDKRIIFPVVGTLSFEGYIDEPVTGDFSNIFENENSYDFAFNFKTPDNETGIRIEIDGARVESQSFDQAIGDNLTFSSEFSFAVSATDGFRISGASSFLINDPDAVYYLDIVGEQNPENRTIVETFITTLKSEGLWDKISGIYPFVGQSQYYGYNLKDPRDSDEAFRLTFEGSNTAISDGVVYFLGTDDYANTHFNPTEDLAGNTFHIAALNKTNASVATPDIGCIELGETKQPRLALAFDYNGGSVDNDSFVDFYNPPERIIVREVGAAFYVASRHSDSSAFLALYNNNSVPTSVTSNSSITQTTSSTSITLGVDAQVGQNVTFAIPTGLSYVRNQTVKVSYDDSNYVIGTVDSDIVSTDGNLHLTVTEVSGSGLYSSWTVTSKPNLPMFVGTINAAGSPQSSPNADRQLGFLSFGEGLTLSESNALHAAVKTMHSSLGRLTGEDWLTDFEALNYLNAVGENDSTNRTAIINFVGTLKSEGLWDKILAIYPFFGGTSYYGYNLKDPRDSDDAYRLSFSDGFTDLGDGRIYFNQNKDYANSHFNPRTDLSDNSVHIAALHLEDVSDDCFDIGCLEFNSSNVEQARLLIHVDQTNNQAHFDCYWYNDGNENARVTKNGIDSAALYIASRASDSYSFLGSYKASGGSFDTNSNTINASRLRPNADLWFGIANKYNGSTSVPFGDNADRYYGFLSFGKGLSQAEADAYHQAIKTLYAATSSSRPIHSSILNS